MTTLSEMAGAGASLYPGLTGGLRTLSDNQAVVFTKYTRYVLPLDGYVFWLKADTTTIQGSLHVGIDKRQNEDETIAISRVVFTTGELVQAFNAIQPNVIWVGQWGDIRFAFSRSGLKYRAADIFHYHGDAVYPALESQLVDVAQRLPLDTLIVSNSLPAWLTLATYNPIWLDFPNPSISLYPSYLVPDNLRPPYGVVHIESSSTKALQAIPHAWQPTGSQHQLVTERVELTLYGLDNQTALNFANVAKQYSEDTNAIGFANMPAVRDEKRGQAELGILAQKKTIEYEVNYLQGTMRDVALQLITQATATILPPIN